MADVLCARGDFVHELCTRRQETCFVHEETDLLVARADVSNFDPDGAWPSMFDDYCAFCAKA